MKEIQTEIENHASDKSGWNFLAKNEASDTSAKEAKHGLLFIELFAGIIKAIAG